MYQNFPDEQILSEHLVLKNAAVWCFFNIYIDMRHWGVLLLFLSGPKACGEGIKACECHPGGEGERKPAEPAAGGLQQGELLPEQPGAH